MEKLSVGVVLPAAGCGERMKLSKPKQFCEVNGRPLICYTINCFHRLPWVASIVLSTTQEQTDHLKGLADKYGFDKVTVVEGGSTRHRSIWAGIKALIQLNGELDVVVVHDAVRPFVSADILKKIVTAAHEEGAAGVCRPLVSTVISRDEGQHMTESLDRGRYFNSEMPQAFHPSVIAEAYGKCTKDEFEFGTECLLLAMKYSGVRPRIVDGTPDLWKVTYKKDLLAAESVIKEHMTRVKVIQADPSPQLAECISSCLQAHHIQLVHPKPASVTRTSDTREWANTSDMEESANTHVILYNLTTVKENLETGSGDGTLMNNASNILNNLDTVKENSETGSGDAIDAGKTSNILNNMATVKQNSETGSRDGIDTNKTSRSNISSNCIESPSVLETPSLSEPSPLERPTPPTSHIISTVLQRVRKHHRELEPCEGRSQLCDISFVHVFVANAEEEMAYVQAPLSKALAEISAESRRKGVLVYGLLTHKGAASLPVGEMVTSLIYRGHSNFSGQLFTVY